MNMEEKIILTMAFLGFIVYRFVIPLPFKYILAEYRWCRGKKFDEGSYELFSCAYNYDEMHRLAQPNTP